MKLSDQQINDFIELYKKKYGVVLNFQEAMEKATRFVRLIEIVESRVY